ncbi:MAG: hypothetical protein Q7J15_07375 [Candidatus Desulfaltia sp.]|nr:hypothetical protein [Candidatus Desulfaltia sp.]
MTTDDESLIYLCTNISSCKTNITKKRYKIPQDVFCVAYLQHNSYAAVAAELGCSVHYVRRTAKKYDLPALAKHGGKRAAAGRPAGAENNKKTEYSQLMRQLYVDQRTNSAEVGIRPGAVAVGSNDYYKFAGNAYENGKRKQYFGVAAIPTTLPAILKPSLAKT